jgi:hypothetical protein
MPVSTKIQLRRDTAANWTSTNPTLAAGEIGFDTTNNKFKIGDGSTAWSSLLYQTDASLLSGAASLTTLTTSGNVTVGGDLTVNGTTTSINSSTIQVDDKNIELASVAAVTGRTGTLTTSSTTVTGTNTAGLLAGQTITKTAGTGTLTGTTIVSIINATAFTLDNAAASGGTLTFDTSGSTNATANGAGLTVLATTGGNKTWQWQSASAAWTSSEDIDLATGKVYEINSTTVLSSTQVLGYSIASANGASTIVARDASGNFSAGTITASLTGTASLASNLTGGTANKGEIVYMSGVNTTSKLTATTTNNQYLAYNTSTNAPYWVTPVLSNTYYGATTSAQLAGVISDETGSGALVFATSPVLTTPNIGVPSFANLVNATQYPLANLTGAATGVLTFLATPSSANLATAVTDETGSGNLVFSTSPTLVTPTLGVASATSINKVAITAPTTSATLTIADGATLATTGAYSINLTATANTAVTLPTSGTLATQTYVGSATVAQANNLTGTTPNLIPYQSASNTTTFLAAPAGNNYVLSANTTGAPYWAAPTATGVTSVSAGTGMSFTTITSTGSVSIDTTVVPRFAATGTFTALQTFQNASNAAAGLVVKNHATQQVNPFEVQYSNGTAMVSVSNTGTLYAITIDGGSA